MTDTNLLSEIVQAVDELDFDKAEEMVKQAIEAGIEPLEIINGGIVDGLASVGDKFDCGEYFLAELTMAGQLSKKLINLVVPHIPKDQVAERKKVVLGTVQGDLHDTGKNLVGLMLTCSGYDVYDMGKDVPTIDLINKVRDVKADALGLSALMVTTMANEGEVIDYLRDMGIRDTVKVVVGGGPTTKEFADSIGADGWAPDASKAVAEFDRVIGIRR
ncbi:MAG: corrinoid protein [Anaerolineales bacterium]|nr:corrinoid protein [Anaerolineales bacterium]